MNYLFANCDNLISLPDISIWDTSKIIEMIGVFYGCKNLSYLPDISKWNISNVKHISFMFFGCESLQLYINLINLYIS